jgi:hypothetical protein
LRLRVVVDLNIGAGPQPYYLLVVPDPISTSAPFVGGVTVKGSVHVVILGSEGDASDSGEPFLKHTLVGSSDALEVPPVRNLSVESRAQLSPNTKWVSVGVEVGIQANRWWLFNSPPNDPTNRSGFVGIDLRAPDQGLPQVHRILPPTGPVTVQRIRLTFCPPEPVFA